MRTSPGCRAEAYTLCVSSFSYFSCFSCFLGFLGFSCFSYSSCSLFCSLLAEGTFPFWNQSKAWSTIRWLAIYLIWDLLLFLLHKQSLLTLQGQEANKLLTSCSNGRENIVDPTKWQTTVVQTKESDHTRSSLRNYRVCSNFGGSDCCAYYGHTVQVRILHRLQMLL